MVIFGHRQGGGGGVQHSKNPEITFFLGKIFKFQGGSGPLVPPSGSAHDIICHITMFDCDRELNAHFYSAASLWYQIPDTLT